MRLGDIVQRIRSKNAGPFWLSIDIFCGTPEVYDRVKSAITVLDISELYVVPQNQIKRFDIESLHVIKFSFPRGVTQGSIYDRDMHGAQFAHLVAGLEIRA